MAMHTHGACFIVAVAAMAVSSISCESTAGSGWRRTVGDTRWSIPPSLNFYSIWSSLNFFQTGDSLIFDFETGFYNVIQVSGEEYSRCTSENPLKILNYGPAIILLNEVGVFYYICNISNYCNLGQKVSVTVHKNIQLPPAPSPPPPAVPIGSPEPFSGEANFSQPPTHRTSTPAPSTSPSLFGSPPYSSVSLPHNWSFGCAVVICLVIVLNLDWARN